MSSGQPEIIYQEFIESSYEKYPEREFNISQIIIPFSNICKSFETGDIYNGNEKIPFKERDPDYKQILKQEFY